MGEPPPNPFDAPTFSAMADRMAQRVQELKDMMPQRDIGPCLVETWEYLGLLCGIGGTAQGGCGYVRLPPPLRGAYSWHGDMPYEEIDAHGGLTYGVDGAGWVGFDTAHCSDYWEVEALAPLLDRLEYEELKHVREIYARMPDGNPQERWQRISWTVPLLKGAVMCLAFSIFLLDPPRMLTAGRQYGDDT